jgi:hypothetical protein
MIMIVRKGDVYHYIFLNLAIKSFIGVEFGTLGLFFSTQ